MRCPQCGEPVVWTVTDAGRRLAVNKTPDENGNTAAYRDGTGTWRSRRPTDELPLARWEKRYMPHVATCQAQEQRRKRRPAVLPPGVADMAAYRRRDGP